MEAVLTFRWDSLLPHTAARQNLPAHERFETAPYTGWLGAWARSFRSRDERRRQGKIPATPGRACLPVAVAEHLRAFAVAPRRSRSRSRRLPTVAILQAGY